MDANERAYLARLANALREALDGVKHPGKGERKVIKVAKELEEMAR